MSAKLYMVATPIGNLDDFSPRGAETLRQVDLIACEDTRHSHKLLAKMGISTKLVALHEHNEFERSPELIHDIKTRGLSLAYISDAGTPGISDPGALLCAEAHRQGVPVFSISGPSALTAAVAASGFHHSFVLFVGFLPRKPAEKNAVLARVRGSAPCQFVFYESPKRILDTLQHLSRHCRPDLTICVSRVISKVFESHRVCPLHQAEQLIMGEPVKGEFSVSMSVEDPADLLPQMPLETQADQSLDELAKLALASHTDGVPLKESSRQVAIANGTVSARSIYQAALQVKKDLDDD